MEGFCYRFLDKFGNVLYVGKTKNLFNRISNHRNLTISQYGKVDKIQYIKFPTYNDAGLCERYFIDKYNPPFNTDMTGEGEITVSLDLSNYTWEDYDIDFKQYFLLDFDQIFKNVCMVQDYGDRFVLYSLNEKPVEYWYGSRKNMIQVLNGGVFKIYPFTGNYLTKKRMRAFEYYFTSKKIPFDNRILDVMDNGKCQSYEEYCKAVYDYHKSILISGKELYENQEMRIKAMEANSTDVCEKLFAIKDKSILVTSAEGYARKMYDLHLKYDFLNFKNFLLHPELDYKYDYPEYRVAKREEVLSFIYSKKNDDEDD